MKKFQYPRCQLNVNRRIHVPSCGTCSSASLCYLPPTPLMSLGYHTRRGRIHPDTFFCLMNGAKVNSEVDSRRELASELAVTPCYLTKISYPQSKCFQIFLTCVHAGHGGNCVRFFCVFSWTKASSPFHCKVCNGPKNVHGAFLSSVGTKANETLLK